MRRRHNKKKISISKIAFMECPAKTYIDNNGKYRLGHNVFNHCKVVGKIAEEIIKRLPNKTAQKLFPKGSHLVVACHDIGKVSPTFYLKLLIAADKTWEVSHPELKQFVDLVKYENERWGGHAGVSQLSLSALNVGAFIPQIAGQHHGSSPQLGNRSANDENLGGTIWEQERQKLISALKKYFKEDWPVIQDETQCLLISGLTSIADWIGSGSFFEKPNEDWESQISLAVDNAGFISPKFKKKLSFTEVFNDVVGKDCKPRKTQSIFIEHCNEPGVYILEAPMGVGKTEAALYAAYQRLVAGEANGIYFALPTQLTSNKIYERFNKFLSAILEENCQDKKALLLHSHAWLLDTEIGEEGNPGKSWFNTSKRGLLAPFAVGTLDQALMAVMNVRHGFVRTFGLAGKVVILDEIHSYDAYTNVLIKELIKVLRQLNCTIIILSATLNKTQRSDLLTVSSKQINYPLLTSLKKDQLKEIKIPKPKPNKIKVKIAFKDNNLVINEAIKRAEQGQQILWIENTVEDAQELYSKLAWKCKELNIECGLLHSRYSLKDREKREDYWCSILGKEGWDNRVKTGRILVGTQVLEQSLDIDADFMITRFSPIDMLLQRLGRLWRHLKKPRNESAVCEAWILAPNLNEAIDNPIESFGKTAHVYNPYILCRSLDTCLTHLNQNKNIFEFPLHITKLIEATYTERNESGKLAKLKYQLYNGNSFKKGINALKQLARLNLSTHGITYSDVNAQTRYSESDSAQILLVKAYMIDHNLKQTQIQLLNDSFIVLPWNKHLKSKSEWKQISADLMKHIVCCHEYQKPRSISEQQHRGIEHALFLGKKDENVNLSIALSENGKPLSAIDHTTLSDCFEYTYRKDLGLKIEKLKK